MHIFKLHVYITYNKTSGQKILLLNPLLLINCVCYLWFQPDYFFGNPRSDSKNLAPKDTLSLQFLYLWLREHPGRAGSKTAKSTIPEKPLWTFLSRKWLKKQDPKNSSTIRHAAVGSGKSQGVTSLDSKLWEEEDG